MRAVRYIFPLIFVLAAGCGSDEHVVDIVPPQQTTLLTITGRIAPLERISISSIYFDPAGNPLDVILEFRPVNARSWNVVVTYFAGMETAEDYQSQNRVHVQVDRAGRVQPSRAVLPLPYKTSLRDEPLEMELNIRVADESSTIAISWQNGYPLNRGYAPWLNPD